jgi:hypothetical protein
LKNAHLSRCAASLVNRHTSMYASFLGFCAPYIWAFLNSLFKIEFFNKLLNNECAWTVENSRRSSLQALTRWTGFSVRVC